MEHPAHEADVDHGLGDPGPLRYALLYAGQLAWVLVGLWLLRTAQWPSTCTPDALLEIGACSMRLPESGRWHEYALLTWLWASPLLLVLELARRLGIGED